MLRHHDSSTSFDEINVVAVVIFKQPYSLSTIVSLMQYGYTDDLGKTCTQIDGMRVGAVRSGSSNSGISCLHQIQEHSAFHLMDHSFII
jgi:hypothetical protein